MKQIKAFTVGFPVVALLVLQFLCVTLFYSYLFFFFFNFHTLIGFYLGFHILVLNPFVRKFVALKQLEPLEIIHSLKNPIIIKYLITGLVYPYIFLIMIGFLRYYTLGKTLTPFYINWNVEYFLYVLFFSLYILLILFKIKSYVSVIKKQYLEDTYLITYSLHLYFLRNYYYRMLLEKIHKCWWVFHSIFGKNSLIYPSWYTRDYENTKKSVKISKFRKILNFFYDKPQIFSIFVCLFVLFEIAYNKSIYYSSYVLFYYFLLDLLITGLYKIGYSNFIMDCCYSNYLNEKSWENPYFPHLFATFCQDPNLPYLYTRPTIKEIPEAVLLKLNELEFLAEKQLKNKESWYRKLRFAVLKTDATIFHRVKLDFHYTTGMSWRQHTMYAKNQKRFVHTGSSSITLHPSTPFFFTKPIEKLAQIKKAPNWIALHTQIQMLERVKTTQEDSPEYDPLLHNSIVEQQTSSVLIRDLEEFNLKASFNSLAEAGVSVTSHKEPYDSKTQPEPDIRTDFSRNWKYPFKGIIGVDQKATPRGIACNNIVSISKKQYQNKLYAFETVLRNEGFLSPANRYALALLRDCPDEIRKEVWASVLHFFPLNRIPLINTAAMIDEVNFTSATKDKFVLAEKEIETMSNRLHRDFPNQINQNWAQLKQSAQELTASKNPAFSCSQETLDLVITCALK